MKTKYSIPVLFKYSLLFAVAFPLLLLAQPELENLGRGVIAVKVTKGVFISWRLLGFERTGVTYNLFRNSIKINPSPITGATNFVDKAGSLSSKYSVSAVYNGTEHAQSKPVGVWNTQYMEIPLRCIPGNYEPNDASAGDLDGDGEYEIIIKRIPPVDVSYSCIYFPLIEAYKLDGTFLWASDMGPNHLNFTEIDFAVYDFDGDGKSEIALRTCEGFKDGTGVQTGDMDGDGILNYRKTHSYHPYITKGPEFISILDGKTGKLLVQDKYIERDPVTQWGGGGDLNKAIHRAKKFMLSPAYLNGINPSLVICRGTYHKFIIEAWNFRKGKLLKLWRFNTDDWPDYISSGAHNMSIADVDNDGKDEIIYGSCVIDDNGQGLHTTGLGHGDALHVSDMDPDRPGLEIWQCLENPKNAGAVLRDANTGEKLIRYLAGSDQGRACAANINPQTRGYELWGSTGCPFYSINGNELGQPPRRMNHLIYWDEDIERELLDHLWDGEKEKGTGIITKYLPKGKEVFLLTANGTLSNNYTKGNPCLTADLFGDWREEVIWRTEDNKSIRIYTSTIPSKYRIYTLMHDPQYRIAVSWQQNSYNQPPHQSFYLGDEFTYAPASSATTAKLVWAGSKNNNSWDKANANWTYDGKKFKFTDGDSVIFGFAETKQEININSTLYPKQMTVFSPLDYTFNGSGKLSGNMALTKSGKGTLTLNNINDFTGEIEVWDGKLIINNALNASHITIFGGTFGGVRSSGKSGGQLGGSGIIKGRVTIESRGCISPGDNIDNAGTLVIEKSLALNGFSYAHFDLVESSSGTISNDLIDVQGNISISDSACFLISPKSNSLKKDEYILIRYTGYFSGNINNIKVLGVKDATLTDKNKYIALLLH